MKSPPRGNPLGQFVMAGQTFIVNGFCSGRMAFGAKGHLRIRGMDLAQLAWRNQKSRFLRQESLAQDPKAQSGQDDPARLTAEGLSFPNGHRSRVLGIQPRLISASTLISYYSYSIYNNNTIYRYQGFLYPICKSKRVVAPRILPSGHSERRRSEGYPVLFGHPLLIRGLHPPSAQ